VSPKDWLQVGVVVRAHGIRGALRVRGEGQALLALRRVFLDGKPCTVSRARPDKAEVLLELDEVRDRDQAEALRGKPLFVARADLPPLDENELFVADLVGCRVFDAAGRLLGEVAATFPNGAQEVLEVRGARDFLLPFCEPLVVEADLPARRIVCDPPPGLIDPGEAEDA
jgi:16S rRNA processing protein RimM